MTRWSSGANEIELSLDVERLSVGITVLFWILVFVQWTGHSVPIVRPTVGFIFLTFLPGALFLSWLGIKPRMNASWLVYVVGSSLFVLMTFGLVLYVFLTLLGFDATFSLETFSIGITAVIATLLYFNHGDDTEPLNVTIRLGNSALVFLQLPLWAILAVSYLNNTGTNVPLIVVLGVLSILPILVVIGVFPERELGLGVWAMALAVLYHKSLWGMHVYHGHSSAITIWNTGIWDPATENLLSLAVIPPMFAFVLDISILTQLKVVHPVLVAFIPLGMYAAFRSYAGAVHGFLGASLFVFAHPFYFQYPSEPRVGLPVLFLVLLAVVISDDALSQVQTRILSLLFGGGIVVSHYGTSYYVMFAIVGAGMLRYVYPAIDRLVSRFWNSRSNEARTRPIPERVPQTRIQALSWSFGGFYLVATLTWYHYTKQSRTFDSLVEHVFNALESLVSSTSLGSTATRLQTDYGGISIELSKYLYMLFGLLLALGLLASYYRRFLQPSEAKFDDEFLALSSFLFALFGGSLVFSGEWGGGRPMMIVFCFAGIFIVIGTQFVSRLVRHSFASASRYIRGDVLSTQPPRFDVPFGALLAVFLLLNTGVVATSVPGGRAPSNVPLQDEFSSSDNPNLQTLLFVSTDTELHAWLAVNMNYSYEIYGDRIARAQATDWYVGRILTQTGPLDGSFRFQKSNHLHYLDGGNVEPGYLMLIGHNVVYGTIAIDYISWGEMDEYDLELDDRNRIYTNGQGMVYASGTE